MSFKRSWLWPALTIAIAATIVLAACSSPGTSGSAAGDDDGDVSGALFVSGSSTVEPISRRNAEKFSAEQGGVDISVEGPGTSDGFALFCAGDNYKHVLMPLRRE